MKANELDNELRIAYEIAKNVHSGQVDKANAPYMNHINAVMAGVPLEKEKTIAALHDVIEDSPEWDANRLLLNGISQEVIDAVIALSKHPKEKYKNYLKRVKQNSLATIVKLSDLNNNKDLSRLTTIIQKDLDRTAKYEKAILFLKV